MPDIGAEPFTVLYILPHPHLLYVYYIIMRRRWVTSPSGHHPSYGGIDRKIAIRRLLLRPPASCVQSILCGCWLVLFCVFISFSCSAMKGRSKTTIKQRWRSRRNAGPKRRQSWTALRPSLAHVAPTTGTHTPACNRVRLTNSHSIRFAISMTK